MSRIECVKPSLPYAPTWDITDASKLTAFATCPRQYFYEYILGWRPQLPSNHLIFGTSWHLAMEALLLGQSVPVAFDLFLTDYRKTFGPETDELYAPKNPANAEIVLYAYAAKYANDLDKFDVLHTEVAGTVAIASDQKLHFRMDSVCRDKRSGRVFSLEHKTGSRSYNWEYQWNVSFQIGTYTHVLYCLYPPEEVDGVKLNAAFFTKAVRSWKALSQGETTKYNLPFEFLRLPVYRSIPQMQQWLWNATFWTDQLEWQWNLLLDCDESDSLLTCFPQNPTACSKFFGCDYRDFCSAWRNPLHHCYEPPQGFAIEHWDPSDDGDKDVPNFNLGENNEKEEEEKDDETTTV